MRVEQLNQLGEVGERARQPVGLVDDDHVDPVSANVVEQPLERRAPRIQWHLDGSRSALSLRGRSFWHVHRLAGLADRSFGGGDTRPRPLESHCLGKEQRRHRQPLAFAA